MAVKHYLIKLVPTFSLNTSSVSSSPPAILLDSSTTESTEVFLGRSSITAITDKRCSRQHTKVKLDRKAGEIVFVQAGSNGSCLIHRDNRHSLSKHDIKRLPLDELCVNAASQSSLFLIEKDSLYGYKINVTVTTVNKPDSGDSSSMKITNTGETRKRPPTTLDSFVTKKARVESDSTKTRMESESTKMSVESTSGHQSKGK